MINSYTNTSYSPLGVGGIKVLFDLYSIVQFCVNQDTTTVFTNHHFFTLLDLTLLLRWNVVEATTAGVSFYRYYSQTIAIIFTDLFIAGQQTRINMRSCFLSLLVVLFFFFFSSGNDLFKLAFLCI